MVGAQGCRAINLRVSSQHRAKTHVSTHVTKQLDDGQLIEPDVVVHQCPFPYIRPMVAMSSPIRLDTSSQFLQLHMHGCHIRLSHRRMHIFSSMQPPCWIADSRSSTPKLSVVSQVLKHLLQFFFRALITHHE